MVMWRPGWTDGLPSPPDLPKHPADGPSSDASSVISKPHALDLGVQIDERHHLGDAGATGSRCQMPVLTASGR